MAKRSPRKFLLRRSKDNLNIVFSRRAKRVGQHPLGNLMAVINEASPGRISIKNVEESELRGEDFFEIRNVRFNLWYTRYWNNARDTLTNDKRVASFGDGASDVVTSLNNILGFTTEVGVGDEGCHPSSPPPPPLVCPRSPPLSSDPHPPPCKLGRPLGPLLALPFIES